MGKAEDGILVDDNVYSATKDMVCFEDPVSTTVKGKVSFRPIVFLYSLVVVAVLN
jgi:hypothetical protein